MPKTPKTESEWAAWKADARAMADKKVRNLGRNDGLEAAALYHDKIAGEFRVLAGQDIMNAPTYLDSAVGHGCDAASIRALKESK